MRDLRFTTTPFMTGFPLRSNTQVIFFHHEGHEEHERVVTVLLHTTSLDGSFVRCFALTPA